MKKILFTVVPVMALSVMLNNPIDPLPIGSPMPKAELKMQDISGKELGLKDIMTDKGILVMFSCNTCPYVIKNQGRTHEICQYAMQKGMGVALLNSNEAQRGDADSYEDMKTYARNQDYSWFYLVDKNSVMADAFGANRTPECFLFDASGKLVYHGAIDDNPNDAGSVIRRHLREAIDEVLNGKSVTVKESRSVGCGIKRL